MRIYLGADHRGFELKEKLKDFLTSRGYDIEDLGNTEYDKNDDYPDFAAAVARSVSENAENRGIVLCGSGVGVDIVTNKFDGVRSVLAANKEQATASRKDDNTNVLSIAADYTNFDIAKEIVLTWLKTDFSHDARHERRIHKIEDIEETN